VEVDKVLLYGTQFSIIVPKQLPTETSHAPCGRPKQKPINLPCPAQWRGEAGTANAVDEDRGQRIAHPTISYVRKTLRISRISRDVGTQNLAQDSVMSPSRGTLPFNAISSHASETRGGRAFSLGHPRP